MSAPETDITKTGETVITETATGTGIPSLPAIDGRKVVGRIKISATDPGVNDDETQGFAQGLRWVNTTNPIKSYVCVDATTGAAIWRRESNIKNTVAAGTPITSNDNTEGYEIGSYWFDTDENDVYVATSVVSASAKWKLSSVSGAGSLNNPGEYMFGTLLDYPSPGNVSAGTVFYLRLKFSAGAEFTDMRTFIDSGGTAARELRMGLYDQLDPSDPAGEPDTRIAQTESVATTGQSGLFMTVPFIGGTYTVSTTGFYWLAVVADSTSLKFAVTAAARANFLPVRQESGTGTNLPATAGILTNPVSSVLYIAAVEA